MQNGESGDSGELSEDMRKDVPKNVRRAGTAKRRHLARALKGSGLVLALVAGTGICLLSMQVKWRTQRMTTGEIRGHRATVEFQYPETWIRPNVYNSLTVRAEIYPKPISKFTKWCSQLIPVLRYLDTDNKFGVDIVSAPPQTSPDPYMASQDIAQLVNIYGKFLKATNIHVDSVGEEGRRESGEIVKRLQLEMHDPRTHQFSRVLVISRRRAKSAVKAEHDFVYDNCSVYIHGPEATVAAMRPTIDEIFRRVRLVEEK